ncbi:MAG: hypothetical protein V1903_14055 [Bacteroidota bacterium]
MNGLEFLDLVIGLIFIYLIYSIGASTLWEIFVNLTHMRGRMLRKWVINTFSELKINADKVKKTTESSMILDHSLILGLSGDKKPSYISSASFTDVLLDLVIKADNTIDKADYITRDLDRIRDSFSKTQILPGGLKGVFLQYADEAGGNVKKFRDKISMWYDEAQENLIGSYKKILQRWILLISIVLVSITNADTIRLASYLYVNDEARLAVAEKATSFIQDTAMIDFKSKIRSFVSDPEMDLSKIDTLLTDDIRILKTFQAELENTQIPIGWNSENLSDFDFLDWLIKIGGLLLTALAVSMGSPFWFDVLSKLSNLRSAGNKPKVITTENKKTEKRG